MEELTQFWARHGQEVLNGAATGLVAGVAVDIAAFRGWVVAIYTADAAWADQFGREFCAYKWGMAFKRACFGALIGAVLAVNPVLGGVLGLGGFLGKGPKEGQE